MIPLKILSLIFDLNKDTTAGITTHHVTDARQTPEMKRIPEAGGRDILKAPSIMLPSIQA